MNTSKKEKMIKIISLTVAALTLVCALLSAVGCSVGDGKESESESGGFIAESKKPESSSEGESQDPEATDFNFMEEDLSKYLTLGQYKGYEFQIPPMQEVTDEDVEEQIRYDLLSSDICDKVTDRAVTKDDVVYIDYKGFMNGEQFQGGTGSKDKFTIYNGGGFIDGFADGIVGATPGVEVAVELKFPDNYHSTDLAGKPVTFMVTVKHIYEAKELTDAVAAELSGDDGMTASALRADYKVKMEERVLTNYEDYKASITWQKILSAATEIELPKALIDQYYNSDVQYYKTYAMMYGMSYEDFLKMMGTSEDELYAKAHDSAKHDIVVFSVIKAESLALTDSEFDEMLDELVKSSGYSKDKILENYSKADLTEMFLYTKCFEEASGWQTFVPTATEG